MRHEHRLEKYSVTILNYTLLRSGCATLSYCELANIAATQLPQALSSRVSFLSDFIYLPGSVFTESDKSYNLHTYVVWFYVVSKGNGFSLIKRAV